MGKLIDWTCGECLGGKTLSTGGPGVRCERLNIEVIFSAEDEGGT